jgi:hypothetical protein
MPDVPTILRRLPFFPTPTTLRIPGGAAVSIKHHQIVLWVSITRREASTLAPQANRFPAVFDTGFNDNFLIQEQQFVNWAGVTPSDLPLVDYLSADGRRVPLRDANVWIHPNQPGFRDQPSGGEPFCFELDSGIAVWPTALPGARRLPLLGLRGVLRAGLQIAIDGRKRMVSMRTPEGSGSSDNCRTVSSGEVGR